MVDTLSYFSFQPVLHDLSNKGRGIYILHSYVTSNTTHFDFKGRKEYPVCGMMYIKEPLLLIEKCSPCSGGSGFHRLLSEWSFTI